MSDFSEDSTTLDRIPVRDPCAAERDRLEAALRTLNDDWKRYNDSGIPMLPEDHRDVPWPVRNFVRRVRAALGEAEASEETGR